MERFKATVRRRNASDDDGLDPEDIWPVDLQWISDYDRYDEETGAFLGGCTSPYRTHAEALADAVHEADASRRRNLLRNEA